MPNSPEISQKTRRLTPTELRELGFGGERRLIPYLHKNPLIRSLFWSKMESVLECSGPAGSGPASPASILEIGCGGGLALPLFSSTFSEVYGVDLDVSFARKIVEKFGLNNVKLFEGDIKDIRDASFGKQQFDLVFASSVFEHIKDLEKALPAVRDMLSPTGRLITVSPTENGLYRFGRLFFGHKKPEDHYHTAREIRDMLENHFTVEKKKYLPFNLGYQLSLYEVLFLSRK